MYKKNRYEKLIKSIGILILLFIISHFIPTSYFIISPGITQELSAIITVEDGFKGQSKGDFMLTAVSQQRAMIWDYMKYNLFKTQGIKLEKVSQQLPEGIDMNKYLEIMSESMEESKLLAQAVAFDKAGYDVKIKGMGAEIVKVLKEGSAINILKEDDIIIEIDGKKVELANDAVNLIRKHEIGDIVNIKIKRNKDIKNLELKTVEIENNPGKASLGIYITSKNIDFDFPRKVSFHTENVIGPSAGGMFTLEIYNQLTSYDISRGKKIAGTGTISMNGNIGRIDGVLQKVIAAERAGAELFIIPEENMEDIKDYNTNITLLSVKNIDDILNYLQKNILN